MANTDPNYVPLEYMLSTIDNPYDPFEQWDEWYMWDLNAGYHTPGLLARISKSSNDLSEADQYLAVQDAIDEIVRENVSGVHRKLRRGELANLIATNQAEIIT